MPQNQSGHAVASLGILPNDNLLHSGPIQSVEEWGRPFDHLIRQKGHLFHRCPFWQDLKGSWRLRLRGQNVNWFLRKEN